MTNAIQIFVNTEFGNIRTLNDTLTGKILFCGKDVAEALGYSNTKDAIIRHCRGVVKRDLGVKTGQRANGTDATQIVEAAFIPEGDVYRLIVRSNLPTAEKFERWVFDEVLPSIRKTGSYSLSKPQLPDFNNPVIAARAWADEVEVKIALQAKVDSDAPKVEFAERFRAEGGSILVAYLAERLAKQGMDIGTNRLFALLRKEGYLCSDEGLKNKPTKKSIDQKLFDCEPYSIHGYTTFTPKVTPKGVAYFLKKYLG